MVDRRAGDESHRGDHLDHRARYARRPDDRHRDQRRIREVRQRHVQRLRHLLPGRDEHLPSDGKRGGGSSSRSRFHPVPRTSLSQTSPSRPMRRSTTAASTSSVACSSVRSTMAPSGTTRRPPTRSTRRLRRSRATRSYGRRSAVYPKKRTLADALPPKFEHLEVWNGRLLGLQGQHPLLLRALALLRGLPDHEQHHDPT